MEYRPSRSGGPEGRPRRPAQPRDRQNPAPRDRGTARESGRDRGYGRPEVREARRSAPRERVTAPPPRTRGTARPVAAAAGKRNALVGGRVVLVVISALVVGVTFFAWRTVGGFSDGNTTYDFGSDAGPKPADGAMDILLVGMDSRTNAKGEPLKKEQLAMLSAGVSDGTLNTDSLILIRIPNDGGKAIGVSIPRDSYVDIPGGFGEHKINSAYARAKLKAQKELKKNGATDGADLEVKSNQEGAKNLTTTIEGLTGVTIDHYAEVNLLGFYDITNAIGGIDVCLNKATKDKNSGANFPAGPQTISGVPALAFVRQRENLPRGDLDRIVRQQVFMSGMAKKVLSTGVLTSPSKIGQLQAAVTESVVLDRGWDVFSFAAKMTEFTGGKLEFNTIPTGRPDLKTDDGDAIEIDPEKVKAYVAGLIGPPPAQSPSSSAPSDPPASNQNSAVTVDVRNATGESGLASKVSKKLTGKGFTAGETGNSSSRSTSVVRYASGGKTSAQEVADVLGGDIKVEEDKNLGKGHVTVYLGKDYDDTAELTGPAPLRLSPYVRQPAGPPCVN